VIIIFIYLFTKNITLNEKITIEQGESVSKIFNKLSTLEKLRIKIYIFNHSDTIDFSKLEAGNYTFSGSYTKAELIQKILQ
jgi:cell division protein YceG involved in septum cleavage